MARDSQAREADGDESLVNRRSYLKFMGLATAPVMISETTDSAQAASSTSGFGEGSYGYGGYGGTSTESALAVSTGDSTNLSNSAATLNGKVTDFGGASSVDAAFEIRQANATTWTTTSTQTLSSINTFSTTVTNLSRGTDYEFRAIVAASDGDTATGSTQVFTTLHSPDINRLRVSESGSPNPHAEISVTWEVSDSDTDLETVEITITDTHGQLVRSTTTNVSGEHASGSESHKIKQGGGTIYNCTLTVTDSQSQQTSRTRTVSA